MGTGEDRMSPERLDVVPASIPQFNPSYRGRRDNL